MNLKLKGLLEENAIVVDSEIEKLFPKLFDESWMNFALENPLYKYDLDACNNSIAKPNWDLLSRGGKRWRPLLMRLCFEIVGGNFDINSFLVIPELIHNGTLIIDDIEDGSDLRRGKDCIHKIYGEDIAINAGNSLYYLPLLVVLRNKNLDEKVKCRIYELINQEMIKISFGQGMDIYWHNGDCLNVGEKEYLQMCAYKTGTLARMAARLGAILGNATEREIDVLGRFAESIGVGFQIQDDILNVTSIKLGKDFGEDITEGKRSLIVIRTLSVASSEDKKRLIEILNLHTKDKNLIYEAIQIFEKYDSISYARGKARSIVNNAWNELDLMFQDCEAKNKLELFVEFLIEREF